MKTLISATYAFEIISDFLMFKDPTQIMQLATDMELIYAPELLNIKLPVSGDIAPQAFRTAIELIAKEPLTNARDLKASYSTDTETASTFYIETTQAGITSILVLTIITSLTGIRSLIEAPVKQPLTSVQTSTSPRKKKEVKNSTKSKIVMPESLNKTDLIKKIGPQKKMPVLKEIKKN